ncbi:hypothetical protein D3C75_524180 [compost metagenome]
MRSVTYGSNTQDPNEDTKDYDMLVTDEGFYMIEYKLPKHSPTSAYALKWTFSPATKTSNPAYPGVTGPVYQPVLSFDISNVSQEIMQCNRNLEPR